MKDHQIEHATDTMIHNSYGTMFEPSNKQRNDTLIISSSKEDTTVFLVQLRLLFLYSFLTLLNIFLSGFEFIFLLSELPLPMDDICNSMFGPNHPFCLLYRVAYVLVLHFTIANLGLSTFWAPYINPHDVDRSLKSL